MANTNTIITEDDVIKIGGVFHRHIVGTIHTDINVYDNIEGDEYKTPDGKLHLVNVKRTSR